MEEAEAETEVPTFRDIRRYYCDYCGICRSKKSLIASHVLTHHKDEREMAEANGDGDSEAERGKSNTCQECGLSFKKPAHRKQHMQSHSLERPYVCSVDDCHSSYRRKDHLTRHLFHHQGKLFKCPIENCNSEFAFQGNMTRHVSELHGEDCPSANDGCQKQHVCQEKGCGKVFRFASQLRKHEDSHVKLDRVEAFCSEPGCMKQFPNEQCLKAHIQSCHQHITCEICRTHEEGGSMERIKCDYEGCLQTFTIKSNLRQHVKAVHLENKPFVCCFPGCGKRFAYKHVKDNHEKSGCHVHAHGDFEEADEKFRSRPRGGRKRQCPNVEMLVWKRVSPSKQSGQDTENF